MVELRQLQLNAQLLRYIQEDRKAGAQSLALSPSALSYHRHRRWRLWNRLSEEDIAEIVQAFKAGTVKHILAERYNINLRSLKRLLREKGVKRKSWKDIRS